MLNTQLPCKEKLDSAQISEGEHAELQILQLANIDKLFEGKTVSDAESAV